MYEHDSYNGISHKCPNCAYEVKWDYGEYSYDHPEKGFVKGDQSFVKIENNCGRYESFETDKPNGSYGENERVILLGCPKCGVVSFKQW